MNTLRRIGVLLLTLPLVLVLIVLVAFNTEPVSLSILDYYYLQSTLGFLVTLIGLLGVLLGFIIRVSLCRKPPLKRESK